MRAAAKPDVSLSRKKMLDELNGLPRSVRLGFVWRGISGRVRGTVGSHVTAGHALIIGHAPVMNTFTWTIVARGSQASTKQHWLSLMRGDALGSRLEVADLAMAAWEIYFNG